VTAPFLHRALLAVAVAGLALAAPATAKSDAICVVWPGEPDPLPTLADPDPLRAAWAAARVGELSRLAGVLETGDQVEAYRFRQHARCFGASGMERAAARGARPSPVHRTLGAGAVEPDTVGSGATAGFDAALRLALLGEAEPSPASRPAPRPVASSSPRPEPAAAPARAAAPAAVGTDWLDDSLEALASMIKEARFRSALESVNGIQAQASQLTTTPDLRRRLARVEVLAGTAKVALGQTDSARDHFRRALDTDPALTLDDGISPKVRRTFDSVRSTP
jgi:hypothetical protein